ncbi:hypothetical protein QL285_002787 [Trifolium repens]|nr:hypothetical protein QL285_002787 [Trifolium repens]
MGGSKCSSIGNSSCSNLPRCGCELPMKMWVSNTGLNPKRKFWKCRNSGSFGSCDLLVWDDELYEVEAANPRGQRQASMQLGEEFGKAFGQEFGKGFGHEFGTVFGQEFGKAFGKEFGNGFGQEFDTQIGNEIGKRLGQFVWVAIFMCGIMIAMLFKTM